MSPLPIAKCAIAVAMLTSLSFAQFRGGQGFASPLSTPQAVTPGFATFGSTGSSTAPHFSHHHPFGNGAVFLYSDEGYPPEISQPVSVIVVQPPAPAVPAAQEEHVAADPLLIELRGNRYVKLANSQPDSGSVPADSAPTQHASALRNSPSTTLVFRNHKVEITGEYAIIGDALYAQSNYWTTGAWTKRIALADLDLPATIQLNQRRGVLFKLPAAPNEIVLH